MKGTITIRLDRQTEQRLRRRGGDRRQGPPRSGAGQRGPDRRSSRVLGTREVRSWIARSDLGSASREPQELSADAHAWASVELGVGANVMGNGDGSSGRIRTHDFHRVKQDPWGSRLPGIHQCHATAFEVCQVAGGDGSHWSARSPRSGRRNARSGVPHAVAWRRSAHTAAPLPCRIRESAPRSPPRTWRWRPPPAHDDVGPAEEASDRGGSPLA